MKHVPDGDMLSDVLRAGLQLSREYLVILRGRTAPDSSGEAARTDFLVLYPYESLRARAHECRITTPVAIDERVWIRVLEIAENAKDIDLV
jgi:hypothetical protein